MIIEKRWYLDEAYDAIFNYFLTGNSGNPLVCMPTGTGKSIAIAQFIQRVMERYPRQRFMMLTHVKELINQNAHKLRVVWPDAPLGIHSAGLDQRDFIQPIIYGGVQTVRNCIEKFGYRDLLLIDEAHLLSPKDETSYQKVIAGLKKFNPYLKVVGWTATPWRLGQGKITDGGLFTDIAYDLCSMENFNRLIDDGYLLPLIPRPTQVELDTSNVKTIGGDFNQEQLQLAVDKKDVNQSACAEICKFGEDRRSWLIFASGIDHAMHIATILHGWGISVAPVHSKMPPKECDKYIQMFRDGRLQAIVNYGKLTTGFDHPPIDLIAMLRPTTSTTLWVQMLGRGTRPSHDTQKENCLVLDFARNTPRLGPINDPVVPIARKKGAMAQPGIAPIRICPVCGVYNHARAVLCCNCRYEFPKYLQLDKTAGTQELIRTEKIERNLELVDVLRCVYNRIQKDGKPPMIRVDYYCGPTGLQHFKEHLCFDHPGFASRKAREWWQSRQIGIAPRSTDEALQHIRNLRIPKQIRVDTSKKYSEVVGYLYA